ncbi:hypothetical protein F5148DRAFT_1155081 [Russula earlei]|uniref:Uncharacterized protein n=1 Tax=Russula earlei TaxID=71964 RepID=A0ACC0TR05_9AGAM|nr:hypothetical protein F5148DRAFT_1155081 [Russula earlei]
MAVIHPSTPPQTEQRSHTRTSTPQKLASERYKDMTWDVCDKFVGPMPIAEFLSEFVPEASQARKTERIISFDKRSVSHNEDHFIQAIKTSGLADSLTFVNTTAKQDKAILGRPDIVIYRKREGHQENEQADLTGLESVSGLLLLDHPLWKGRQGDYCDGIAVVLSIPRYSIGTKDPNTLSEFIWRLNSLTFAQRGYDTTVTSVSKNDKGVVYMDVEKIEVEDLRQILVNDDHATDGQPKPYIIWKPIWETKTLFGIEKEGDIYRNLLEAKVRFILELGPAGDMLSTPEHSLDVQCTRTQDYVKDGERKSHTDAYDKAKILHRDVSAGNILIAPDRSGLLIDWDMSKRMDVTQAETTLLHDDIESFYWVLIYIVMKCRHSAIEGQSQDMQHVFDGYRDVDEDGVIRGSDGKLSFLHKLILHLDSFGFVPEPCRQIIEELRTLLKTFYDDINPKSIMPEPQAERNVWTEVKDAHEKLCSSEWVLNLITWNLESKNWSNDDSSLSKNIVGHDPTFSRGCRKHKAKDHHNDDSPVEMGLSFNKKHRGQYPPKGSSLSSVPLQGSIPFQPYIIALNSLSSHTSSTSAAQPALDPLSLQLIALARLVPHPYRISYVETLVTPRNKRPVLSLLFKPLPAAFNTDLVLSGKI